MTNALTLPQPWATLVALGVKTIETRSWAAPKSAIGQRLVIHASTDGRACWEWEGHRPVLTPLGAQAGARLRLRNRPGYELKNGYRAAPAIDGAPLGAVVASCTLTACLPVENLIHETTAKTAEPWGFAHCIVDLHAQLPYGDFRPGRWAWLLDNIKPTTERCPAGCHNGIVAQSPGNPADGIAACDVCKGEGRCDPIPAKGHQRLWKWEP